MTNHGGFTTASAYKGQSSTSHNQHTVVWNRVWKLKVPERVRTFVWRCLHKMLLTNSLTQRWDGSGGLCSICGQQLEDILHALRDCPVATMFWRRLVPSERREEFFGSNR